MIARLTLTLVEWASLALALLAAVSASGTGSIVDITVAGIAASLAATARSIAISRAAGRRFDAAFADLRAAARPSNDIGGLR